MNKDNSELDNVLDALKEEMLNQIHQTLLSVDHSIDNLPTLMISSSSK